MKLWSNGKGQEIKAQDTIVKAPPQAPEAPPAIEQPVFDVPDTESLKALEALRSEAEAVGLHLVPIAPWIKNPAGLPKEKIAEDILGAARILASHLNWSEMGNAERYVAHVYDVLLEVANGITAETLPKITNGGKSASRVQEIVDKITGEAKPQKTPQSETKAPLSETEEPQKTKQ